MNNININGDKIRKILKKLGLRPSHAAYLLGVSPAYVSQVIQGKKKASSVFSSLFKIYRYYVSLQKSIRALSFLSRSFHSSLCIRCGRGILSLSELKNILENQLITELKELKNIKEFQFQEKLKREKEREEILKTLSLFADFTEEEPEPKWHPELVISLLLEEKGCCCKLQVYASSAFVLQLFSDSAAFDIHGHLNELLCLCLSAKLNLHDIEYPYCISPEYIAFKSTRIFFDTALIKDVLSLFVKEKEKKIDLSIFSLS